MRTVDTSLRVAIAVAVAVIATGCAESSFVLARESRLPAWFEPPQGQSRETLTVMMEYYILPAGREAKFTLLDAGGRELMSKTGKVGGSSPITLGDARYPSYEVISIDGIVDLIEHRKMEPVFYMTDNPDLRKRVGITDVRGAK